MFDTTPKRPAPSLLMTAGSDRGVLDNGDPVETHRKARRKRLNADKAPLTSALSPKRHERADDAFREPINEPAPQVAPTPEPAPEVSVSEAEQPAPYANDPGTPSGSIIDPAIVLHTVWNWRWAIAGLTVAGAAAGVMLALSTPKTYTAVSNVLIDPREIRLVERDLTPEFLANEAALAIVDSRLLLARSTPVLERVIERTSLTQDPEFNGEGEGAFGALSIIRGLLSGSDATSDRVGTTTQNLRRSISADRSTRTFIVNIEATSEDPEKAALLANETAKAFIEEQSGLRAESARDASVALSGRLADLQNAVETAEQRVERFRVENNLVNAQGRLITDDEILSVNATLTNARATTRQAQTQADIARTANLDSVVAGGLPTTLVTPALTTFRAQYASLKQQLAPLETQLGPRHPRLENLRASVASAESDIRGELSRIVAGTQADLRAAIQNEQQTAQQLAQLKSQMSNNSDALVQLRELEREASAARGIYESALVRAREAGEIQAVNTGNARIVTQAEAPINPSSTSRRIVVMVSAMAGFALGFGLAVMAGIAKSLHLSSAGNARRAPLRSNPTGPGTRRPLTQPTKTSTKSSASESDMYPPYPPYPYYPQPNTAMYPGQPQPAYQAVQQPMQPMQPAYPMAPAMPVQQPMQGYPQAVQPQIQPVIMPIMQQPMPQQPAPMPQPAPQQATPGHDGSIEMDELRQSVRDIRDMVDHLAARRYG